MVEDLCPYCRQPHDPDDLPELEPWEVLETISAQSNVDGSITVRYTTKDEPCEAGLSALGVLDRMAVAGWVEYVLRQELACFKKPEGQE